VVSIFWLPTAIIHCITPWNKLTTNIETICRLVLFQ